MFRIEHVYARASYLKDSEDEEGLLVQTCVHHGCLRLLDFVTHL